ncbi:hypothetical protein M758_4G045000, partial [Ceratodon purpureus]
TNSGASICTDAKEPILSTAPFLLHHHHHLLHLHRNQPGLHCSLHHESLNSELETSFCHRLCACLRWVESNCV